MQRSQNIIKLSSIIKEKKSNNLKKIESKFEIDNSLIQLKKNILQIKQSINFNGYVILNFDFDKKKKIEDHINLYLKIGKYFGKFLSQNHRDETVVKVYNKGKKLKSGARYHESNVSGNLHTDSPQFKTIPKIVGLYCVNSAYKGGDTVLVNSYDILESLILESKNNIDLLNTKYFFEKRGILKKKENMYTYEKILKINTKDITFRYLRDYIESGHKKLQKKLSKEQINLFDSIDKIIAKKKYRKIINLKKNQCIFINNKFMLHGRTKFFDKKNFKKRLFLRLWIK
ncbi:TauD/TfdA family dioxygenase [Alphaproteobacteria bacterium]|jgi:alpha-ketoglutarate-dependent taurine dioxygenase|nr:TauD/TfdA family dioxygenase [Alphaproteobacteria bacterium]